MNVAYKEEIINVHPYESIIKTIEMMNELERESLKDVGFIDFVKNNFSFLINEKNILIKSNQIHTWIYENLKYVKDNYDETLISPRLLIFFRQGDCDDFAMLTKTDRKSTRLNSSHIPLSRMPSSA